jgi:hypothetical protein
MMQIPNIPQTFQETLYQLCMQLHEEVGTGNGATSLYWHLTSVLDSNSEGDFNPFSPSFSKKFQHLFYMWSGLLNYILNTEDDTCALYWRLATIIELHLLK